MCKLSVWEIFKYNFRLKLNHKKFYIGFFNIILISPFPPRIIKSKHTLFEITDQEMDEIMYISFVL